jgi:hypothetical protein
LLEALIFAGVSTLLYHLGMGFLFFLVPVQVVGVRRGRRSFLVTMGLAFVFILAVKLVSQAGAPGGDAAPFLVMEAFVVLVLMAGLAAVQLPGMYPRIPIPPLRRVTRLVLVTAIAGLISLPVILYLRGNEPFNAGLLQVFDSLAGGLQRSLGMPGAEGAKVTPGGGGDEPAGGGATFSQGAESGGDTTLRRGAEVSSEPPPMARGLPAGPFSGVYSLARIAASGRALMEFVGMVFWRGFLFSYFLLVGASWWLGTRLGVRFPGRGPTGLHSPWRRALFSRETPPAGTGTDGSGPHGEAPGASVAVGAAVRDWPRVVDFRLPDTYIWPLIASLATILIGLMVPLGALELAAWNLAAIVLFLYGLSGIGVLQFFLRKFRVPRGMRLLLAFLLGVLLLSPRANLAVIILIPGLGVSEIWLRYRTRERSNG